MSANPVSNGGSLLRDLRLQDWRDYGVPAERHGATQHEATRVLGGWLRDVTRLNPGNYLLSSHVWRQDHNGFTHQDPGFLDLVTNKSPEVVRVYLPPDTNTLLSTYDHCLRSRHYMNVVVAGKQPQPDWLSVPEAPPGRPACGRRWPTPGCTPGHGPASTAKTCRK